MSEKRPTEITTRESRVTLNGKRIYDAEKDPKRFARRLIEKRKKSMRKELFEIGAKIKAKIGK